MHCFYRGVLLGMLIAAGTGLTGRAADQAERTGSRPLEARQPWGEIVRGESVLELKVEKLPADRTLTIPRLNNRMKSLTLKGGPENAEVQLRPQVREWQIVLPASLPADSRPVVVLELHEPVFVPEQPHVLTQQDDGSLDLPAHEAVTHGELLRYEPQPHKNTVGYWANEKDWCEWYVRVTRPGPFTVELLQGCGTGQGGSDVEVEIAGQKLRFIVEDTGHFQNFKRREIGRVRIEKPGDFRLQIRPVTKSKNAVADIRLVRLVPVPAGEPQVLDDRLQLELIASEPDIVTPVGMTVDARGRLLVIESHTHFPPEGYAGPPHDRIRLIEDTDGDGRADRFRSFHEGTRATMSIAAGPDGWIYVATRMKVFRLRDSDGDDKADQEQEIAHLETEGNYPHNGLCGLCFDGQGGLYFGLGENLGADYALIASDGTKLSGGGEGGNVYHCRMDGTGLRRIATGFWNPFGICVDPADRVFVVGNDPDSSPPCRLVQVVDGGDYGYQFRYGRSGKHPLQAWDGELPGTLPMVAGTSEAPSDVIPYHGQLYVTSWGEYRIERFSLVPHGASFRGRREVVVQGDEQFRPVDFALAPDGSLYFTDWVSRSYNVHGQGRIWRLRWKSEPPASEWPAWTNEERSAFIARTARSMTALSSDDPFLHQAAVMGLAAHGQNDVAQADLATFGDSGQRLGLLEAARWTSIPDARRDALLRAALGDSDPAVRLFAVRWIADSRLTSFRAGLESMLSDPVNSVPLFRATLAAIDWLETGTAPRRGGAVAGESLLLNFASDESRPASLRAMSLKALGSDHPQVSVETLIQLAASDSPVLAREAVHSLVTRRGADRSDALRRLAEDAARNPSLRADAAAGLNPGDETDRKALSALKGSDVAAVAAEAVQTLRRGSADPVPEADSRPAPVDTDAWFSLVGEGGSREEGWRVFFGAGTTRCANCHTLDGRGADVGPDLTGIGRRMGRRRVLESILQPSREIAPRYVPWVIETEAGRVFTGLSLGVPGSGQVEQFLGTDGMQFDLPRDQIAARHLTDRSVMPDGLHNRLTLEELRNLLALLAE